MATRVPAEMTLEIMRRHVHEMILVGDAALRHTAQLLSHHLRKSDLAARFGGEEFAVILASTDRGGALHLAEKIRGEIERGRLVHDGARLGETRFATWLTQPASQVPSGNAQAARKAS